MNDLQELAQNTIGLAAISRVVWWMAITQYVFAIWAGFRDKSHNIPIAANCFFFAHDTTYIYRTGDWTFLVWIIGELFVLYQIIAFSRREIPLGRTVAQALGSYAAILAGFYLMVWWLEELTLDTTHIKLFAMMFVLCSLFNIPMLLRRGSRKGQSLVLAWVLLIQAPICFFIQQPLASADFATSSWYLAGVGTTLLAAVYLWMLYRAPRYDPESGTPAVPTLPSRTA